VFSVQEIIGYIVLLITLILMFYHKKRLPIKYGIYTVTVYLIIIVIIYKLLGTNIFEFEGSSLVSGTMILFLFSWVSFVLYFIEVVFAFRNSLKDDKSMADAFGVVLKVTFLSIVNFALLYYMVYMYDSSAFAGNIGTSMVEELFSFIYFSFVTFTTLGFGDVYPIHFTGSLLVMLEVSFSFVIIYLFLSSFSGLKDILIIKETFIEKKNRTRNCRLVHPLYQIIVLSYQNMV